MIFHFTSSLYHREENCNRHHLFTLPLVNVEADYPIKNAFYCNIIFYHLATMAENLGYVYFATSDSQSIMIYTSGGSTCSGDLEMDSRTWTLYSKNSKPSSTSFKGEALQSQITFLFSNNGKYVKYDLNKAVAIQGDDLVS